MTSPSGFRPGMQEGRVSQPPSPQPPQQQVGQGLSVPALLVCTSGVCEVLISLHAAPSSPPADLQVSPTSPTSITITWNRVPCEDRNSEINLYIGAYQPTQFATSQMGFSVTDISNRVYTAMGLIPRTSYTLQIAAASEDNSKFPPTILFGPPTNVTGVTEASPGEATSYLF